MAKFSSITRGAVVLEKIYDRIRLSSLTLCFFKRMSNVDQCERVEFYLLQTVKSIVKRYLLCVLLTALLRFKWLLDI